MVEYSDAYTREALEKTQALIDALDRDVQQSPCAEQFLDVAAAAFKAHEALIELFEAISGNTVPQGDGELSRS